MQSQIDITFDFRSDTPPGKDPDAFSATLRRYHRFLWSKPLPDGSAFALDDSGPSYLYHRSALGEFFLSSDSVIPTFTGHRLISNIIKQIPRDELDTFFSLGYTIGDMMVFPVGHGPSFNQLRGFHPRIKDRFDLSVECIRRHYCDEWSPLKDCLSRYADSFELFESFPGYVEYFLLQDLVADDCSTVKFQAPFEDFATSPLPGSVDAYRAHRQLAMDFIEARNLRISEYCRLQA
jgi:hypothetical protein